ncbi:hypothetical protein FQA39_LY18019, partial [Lamprigera yunnana]
YRLVCYYMFPSSNGSSILSPKDLDALLCTHVIVGFASIVNNSIYLNERNAAVFQHVVAMKASNADLKVLLSIGGAGTESGFPQMVINHGTRKEFIKSVDELVQKYECDGIDLDWEFPNKVPSEDDKQRMHFTQLLYELRKETNRQHKHKFLISVAVAAPRFFVDLSYDVSYMNNYVDFINLMTYDFHFYTYLTPVTGLNAPLYSTSMDALYSSTLNINYTAHYWVSKGMEKGKINIGLPTYGHSFELFNKNNNGLNAPARSYGHLGTNGFVDSKEICSFLLTNNVKVVFDYSARSPYATMGTEWVSFDDETSLAYK